MGRQRRDTSLAGVSPVNWFSFQSTDHCSETGMSMTKVAGGGPVHPATDSIERV